MEKCEEIEARVELTIDHKPKVLTLNPNTRLNCLTSYKGILLSCAAGALMAFSGLVTKFIPLHSSQILLFRNYGNSVLLLPFITLTKKDVYKGQKNMAFSILYAVAVGVGNVARIDSIQRLPLSDAIVIAFTAPVLVAIFARCCIKDKCSFGLVATLVLTLAGLVLVVKPYSIFKGYEDWNRIMGLCSALTSVLCATFQQMMLATKMKVYHETVVTFHSTTISAIGTLVIGLSLGILRIPTLGESWLLFVQLGCSIPITLLAIRALRYETAAVTMISRLIATILVAFLGQLILFRDGIDVSSICGAVLVLAGAIVLSLKTYLLTLPENNRTRKNLRFLTI